MRVLKGDFRNVLSILKTDQQHTGSGLLLSHAHGPASLVILFLTEHPIQLIQFQFVAR